MSEDFISSLRWIPLHLFTLNKDLGSRVFSNQFNLYISVDLFISF